MISFHSIYHTEERRFLICQIVITAMVGTTGITGVTGTTETAADAAQAGPQLRL